MSHKTLKIKLLRGEERLDSWIAAAVEEVLKNPTWRTEQKTVAPLMETSDGHRRRQRGKVWYAGGMRRLSICSGFQQGLMRHSVLQVCLFFIRQLHFHPLIRVQHKVTLAVSLALKNSLAGKQLSQTGEFVLMQHGNQVSVLVLLFFLRHHMQWSTKAVPLWWK